MPSVALSAKTTFWILHIYKMAPSVVEAPASEIVVPVEADVTTTDTKPKVRRVIDEEGGKTTASVGHIQT
jgi:hypothetical protein